MNEKGMSLIEVAVGVAIIAVSAAIAVPNYQQWAANSDLRAGLVNLKGALQIARVTAMGSGNPVAIRLNSPATNQYVMFVDTNRNGEWDAGEQFLSEHGERLATVSYTHLTLPTTPYV